MSPTFTISHYISDSLIFLFFLQNTTLLEFTVNGTPFIPPTIPVLLQILSGSQTAQDLLPSGSIYVLDPGKTVEISIPGGAAGGGVSSLTLQVTSSGILTESVLIQHPLHLHGHAFDVIRSAGSDTYNYVNPVKRDVVNIGVAGDNVTIRFTTDNPGPWIMHWYDSL